MICRSAFRPSAEPSFSANVPIDGLSIIETFDTPSSATWWLTFTPGPGPEDGWIFDHADIQTAGGMRVRATDTAWIDSLLPLRRNPKFDGRGVAEFDVEVNPDGRRLRLGIEALQPLYRRAAADDVPMGMVMIGVALALGRGAEQDDAAALNWLNQAAARGHAWALLLLGILHANGRGVPANAGRAVAYWQRAAAQGTDRARCLLGDLYANGLGVPEDLELARRCFTLAAANGWAPAEYRLARIHDYGLGVQKDPEAAWHGYRRAAALGHEGALAAFEAADSNRPAYAPQSLWPGEWRARYGGWLRQRRCRASEASAAETVLVVAEACDEALAAGRLSTSHVSILVDAGRSSNMLVSNPTSTLVVELWRRGVDASSVVLELTKSSSTSGRRVAQECIKAHGIPPEITEHVLTAGMSDHSVKVRDEAQRAKDWLAQAAAGA